VICRELRVSRKVVRKVIRSEATEFRYERGTQPLSMIGPWRERLEALSLANELKTPRERLTLIRVFEELRRLGYEGSYGAVRRYAKTWRRESVPCGDGAASTYIRSALAGGLHQHPSAREEGGPGRRDQSTYWRLAALCTGRSHARPGVGGLASCRAASFVRP
jgi:hypothetical protein